MTDAVIAEDLVKTYGDLRALDNLSLRVPRGTVLGVLGPNGAGKTTAVRVLTTLLRPDSGRAVVDGVDVLAQPDAVKRRIGLSGQYAAVDEYLTGFENLDMIGRLYKLPAKVAKARARELLEQFSLTDAGDRPSKTYSGGMRRRLDLAGALVVRPPVLFLDEPTTGLDPRTRGQMWDVIRSLVSEGTSLLLTTQYLEEADHLADNIVVVDHGKVIAEGTADELKSMVGSERLEVVVAEPERLQDAVRLLSRFGEIAGVDEHTRAITVPAPGGTRTLLEAVRGLDAEGIDVQDIGIRRPSLDDAFLTLTGHAATDDTAKEKA